MGMLPVPDAKTLNARVPACDSLSQQQSPSTCGRVA